MKSFAARLADGDEAAFAELYDQCADRLHHYLAVRLGSLDHASDVLQNVFLRAVKSRRRFRAVENPTAYLFQIARNETIRAKSRKPQRPLPDHESLLLATDDRQREDDAEAIAAALARLDPDDRELVELKIYAGLTFREIAAIVEQPLATAATRYRRALESIRDWLAKQLN